MQLQARPGFENLPPSMGIMPSPSRQSRDAGASLTLKEPLLLAISQVWGEQPGLPLDCQMLVSGLFGAWGKEPGEKLLSTPMSHPWKDALPSLGFAQSGGGGKDQIRFVIGRKGKRWEGKGREKEVGRGKREGKREEKREESCFAAED